MRRLLVLTAVVTCGALVAPLGAAEVAKSSTTPKIKRTTPMRVKVGKTVTIRGTGFSRTRKRNTVMFRSPGGRYAFAKPTRASSRKLVVRVPATVERLIRRADGKRPPTRFQLRLIVKKRRSSLTSRRISPILVSSIREGGDPGCNGTDYDKDGLTAARETELGLDHCVADTDRDGVEDGFEVDSSLDINANAKPSARKRPFPNALDPSDAGTDYDGDGLTLGEESGAWAHAAQGSGGGLQTYTGDLGAPAFGGPYGGQPAFGGRRFPINYSDGRQATGDVRPGNPEYRGSLDTDGNEVLTDDERDADGDGLGNLEEIRGLMVPGYYPPGSTCADAATGNDYTYKPLLPHGMTGVGYVDSDSDGDGVWDGNDDQDNDGVSNVDEIVPPYQDCTPDTPGVFTRGPVDGARDGSSRLRNPYNPCLPVRSATCARFTGG